MGLPQKTVPVVSLLWTLLESISPCTFLYLVNVFLLAGMMKNLKSWALKSVFSESATWKKGKAGWVVKAIGCFWTMGSLFPLLNLSLDSWSGAASIIPLEGPCSNQVHIRIWVASCNSQVFVPFLNFTPLFLLIKLSLHCYHYIFFRKVVYALWTPFCQLPPDTLRSHGLSQSQGHAEEALHFKSCLCQSTPLHSTQRGQRQSLSFCSSLSIKMQTNIPSLWWSKSRRKAMFSQNWGRFKQ